MFGPPPWPNPNPPCLTGTAGSVDWALYVNGWGEPPARKKVSDRRPGVGPQWYLAVDPRGGFGGGLTSEPGPLGTTAWARMGPDGTLLFVGQVSPWCETITLSTSNGSSLTADALATDLPSLKVFVFALPGDFPKSATLQGSGRVVDVGFPGPRPEHATITSPRIRDL